MTSIFPCLRLHEKGTERAFFVGFGLGFLVGAPVGCF